MVLLTPGTILQDRYRIERLIGQGGFGAVYEAIDQRLNRRVALKQLMRSGDRLSRQFEREAQLLANLDHRALPNVNDHFTAPEGQFLVMQYVPGDDLGTLLLQRNAPFAVAQVLGWAFELLDTLEYLHNRRPPIVHRDIKPQNLKLQHDGSVMLLDFGLAKGYAGETPPSTGERSLMAYTLGYAPPEQVEGLGTDERSDLYSLGATLYCLICNAAPIEAQTRLLADARGRPDPLRPAHEINPDVPESISRVLEQAMRLEPRERPQSAAEMRTLLQSARDGGVAMYPAAAAPAPAFRSDPTIVDQPATRPTTGSLTAVDAEATQAATTSGTRLVVPAAPVVPVQAADAASRPRRSWLAPALAAAALLVALVVVLALFLPRGDTANGGVASAEAGGAAPSVEVQPTAEAQPSETEPEPTEADPEPTEADPEAAENAPAASEEPNEPAAAAEAGNAAVEQRVAAAEEAFRRAGGLDDAIGELEAAVEQDDANAELHTLLAVLFMQRFQWDDVAHEVDRTLELEPDSAVAHSLRSQVLREQGEYDQALADADRAIELDTELSLGYSARSYIHAAVANDSQDAGLLETAVNDADTAIESAGDEHSYSTVEAHGARANALETRYRLNGDDDDLQQAIEAYGQALAGDVQPAWLYANLGGLLQDAGRPDEARQALEQAIERDPGLDIPYESLGWLLYYQGEYEEAISSFSAAIELQQDDPSSDPYYGRGVAHQAKAELDGSDREAELSAAYDDLAEANSLAVETHSEGERAWIWFAIGSVSQQLFGADNVSAITAYRSAIPLFEAELERNSGNSNAQEGLGWIYYKLEEYDSALTAFDAAIELDSQNPAAHLGKARTLNAQGNTEAACQAISDGLDNQPEGANQELEDARAELECP